MTAVAGLLFLGLAYFVVGQAAALRNDAQGAADAAALAAAQEARDQLRGRLLDAIADPELWDDLLNGEGFEYGGPCRAAAEFASKNDAELLDCGAVSEPDDGFAVTVRSENSVGDSIVPGTESNHAETSATAVIESRCGLGEPVGDNAKEPLLELDCDGGHWTVGSADLDLFPDSSDLFSVHLVD
ncbi:pilus assembly protein TadG-related protein [Streptomyces sp. NPDC051940]|uniref:pilus assembly protein TadG-related protein n=1 Tax=Streptomyces sp. NPDC051940 TaxID=3155675 RepID=UPI003441BAB8